ncbi:MAG: hypothetical protein QW450_01345 [Candidatus Nitrosocaldus sp.]
MSREIEVPKDVRPIMLDGAEETLLGDPMGAKKQYRYGNLHIREYEDKYVVHVDRTDPRKDPFMHIMLDAPELIFASAFGVSAGVKAGSKVYKATTSKSNAIIAGTLTSIATGYMVYLLSRYIKDRLIG